jgi:hypothetical protein
MLRFACTPPISATEDGLHDDSRASTCGARQLRTFIEPSWCWSVTRVPIDARTVRRGKCYAADAAQITSRTVVAGHSIARSVRFAALACAGRVICDTQGVGPSSPEGWPSARSVQPTPVSHALPDGLAASAS